MHKREQETGLKFLCVETYPNTVQLRRYVGWVVACLSVGVRSETQLPLK
jgi:hypothetical protein